MATDDSEKLKKRAKYLVLGCVVLVVLIGGYHFWSVHREAQRLEAEAKAGPHVDVAEVSKTSSERTINLVGEARPFASVTLYAKVSGYLKEIKVDKGDRVKTGDLLAIIESPEIDKEYQGAMADAKNKKSIAGRMNQLREQNLVSPQEADQANSDAEVGASRLGSLAVQKGYETLRAPFDGTVTSRYADPGALVQNAANSQTSALPVVTISQVDRLRVYVYVDQRDASFIQIGSPAVVRVEERPDLHLEAMVSRVSGELDPKTKMLLTEIDVENKSGALVPGSFVQVSLRIHAPEFLQLPVQALVILAGKSMVPILTADDTIHFREVHIGDNDGKMVAILGGVQPGEKVALNVGSSLSDGSHVRPNPIKDAPAAKEAPTKTAGEAAPTKPDVDAKPEAKPGEKPETAKPAEEPAPKANEAAPEKAARK